MNRKLLIVTCSVFLLGGCSAYIPEGYRSISDDKYVNLYETYDEFIDLNVIRHKEFFGFFDPDVPIEIIEGYRGELRILSVRFKYYGRDWIFFNKAIILSPSGNRMVFNFNLFDKKTIVHGGSVTEMISEHLPASKSIELLSTLSEPGVIKVRLSGEYSHDYILEINKVTALKEIIEHYLETKNIKR